MRKWLAATLSIAVAITAIAGATPHPPPRPIIAGHSPTTCRTLPGGGAECSQDVYVPTP